MTVDAFSPRASSTCLRTMRWFFGSRLFAGSLNAAKLIGMRAPGPWTSGAPIVAAEAEPASAAEPATALRATSETVRRNFVERVMREALLRVERGGAACPLKDARAGPDPGPPGCSGSTPCQGRLRRRGSPACAARRPARPRPPRAPRRVDVAREQDVVRPVGDERAARL